jgi:hypothetical protein
MTTIYNDPLRTGDYVTAPAKDCPAWAVVDKNTGKVVTFANTREWARQFASHEDGERIAKVHSVTYEVAH